MVRHIDLSEGALPYHFAQMNHIVIDSLLLTHN